VRVRREGLSCRRRCMSQCVSAAWRHGGGLPCGSVELCITRPAGSPRAAAPTPHLMPRRRRPPQPISVTRPYSTHPAVCAPPVRCVCPARADACAGVLLCFMWLAVAW
jgi:hypothetical protein